MDEYKIFDKGHFESKTKFEKRLNEICQKGWKPISMCESGGTICVLLVKVDKYL